MLWNSWSRKESDTNDTELELNWNERSKDGLPVVEKRYLREKKLEMWTILFFRDLVTMILIPC